MGAFCKMAVVVGMYDINCQGDIENPSLILFSEGLKKKRMGSIPWTSPLQISETSILSQSMPRTLPLDQGLGS